MYHFTLNYLNFPDDQVREMRGTFNENAVYDDQEADKMATQF